jgi:hypothetical protein
VCPLVDSLGPTSVRQQNEPSPIQSQVATSGSIPRLRGRSRRFHASLAITDLGQILGVTGSNLKGLGQLITSTWSSAVISVT